jgi:acyl transferase domain-containing protein/acyl carrier protein
MQNHEPIAITGIGCRFPGGANGPEAFWNLLRGGIDAIIEIPPDRWNIRAFYDAEPGLPGKTNSRWGGFIDGIDQFDPAFFGISPREAAFMDPQQRLLLETAWESLEDAGFAADPATGSDTGVFVGISTNDYSRIQSTLSDRTTIEAHTTTGGVMSIAANRISYLLNMRGPSFVVDTACSSSLVAVHLACQSLRRGECATALAGGVNTILIPDTFIGFSRMSMLSPDGRCKAFDARGNGFVRGEGAGVIVLKPLAAAQADGDRIYAVIRGSAVNQDGRTSSLTVPGEEAQKRLIRDACRDASVDPLEVDYIEAHGTGTAIGDPIETGAIGAVLGENRTGRACVIGSVKTNIGHLEAGSGIAGIIKTALVLHHGEVPPNLHFEQPNPDIDFEKWKLRVPGAVEKLPRPDAVAGINSFGFGGTNAHVILQSAPAPAKDAAAGTAQPGLFALSARDAEGLRALAGQYAGWLATCDESLDNLCHTLGARRQHHSHRLAIAAGSKAEVIEKLNAFLTGETRPGLSSGIAAPPQKIAFVFTGQGPQWWAMGRELLESDAVFRAKIAECDALFQQWGDWSLIEELSRDEASSRMDQTAIAQPAIFALQVALAAWWRARGIEPAAVIGHSVGEAAAAHLCGALDLPSAAKVIFHRGRCMQLVPPTGKMLAVALSPEAASPWLAGFEGRAEIGAVNSPRSITVSGRPDALEQIARNLEAANIWCRFLRVNYAFHSAQMDPIEAELRTALREIESQPPALPICSSVTANISSREKFNAEYWWHNVRHPVRFSAGIGALIEAGFTAFLEIGPHPALSGSVSECLKASGAEGFITGSLRRGDPEQPALLGSLGALHVRGIPVRWPGCGRSIALPLHPWRHERCWHEAAESSATRLDPPLHPLLGRSLHTAEPVWELKINPALLPYLADHRLNGRVVFPAAAYVEMALATGRELHPESPLILEEIEFQRALFLPESDRATRLEISCNKGEGLFRIHAQAGEERSWTSHCTGKIRAGDDKAKPVEPSSPDEIKTRCTEEKSGSDSYDLFRENGFHFGESFRGISRVWRRDGEALGEISAPEKLKTADYLIHPAMLDSCFQVLLFTLTPQESARGLFLPVRIGRIRFFASPANGKILSHVRLTGSSDRAITADIRLLDEEGRVLAVIEKFHCAALDLASSKPNETDDCFYEIAWQESEPEPVPAAQGAWLLVAPEPSQAQNTHTSDQTTPQRVILSEAQRSRKTPRTSPSAPSDLAMQVAAQLKSAGDSCEIATDISKLATLLSDSPKITGVVYFAETTGDGNAEAAQLLCADLLAIVQSLAARGTGPALSVITRGAQPADSKAVSPAHGALLGLARVVMNEHQEMRCRVIDLDADAAPAEAGSLVAELRGGSEEEVALRGGRRFVPRLARLSLKPKCSSGTDTPFRLEVVKPGALDQVEFRAVARRAPQAGEVEVAVLAAGLNFRDVMKVLGIYPIEQPVDQLLGDECAGRVVAVGEGVAHLRSGDEVIVISPGCFSKYITVHSAFVVRKPAHLSFEEAVTLPVTFLTAHYALHHLARIGKGERVLIHAAAGGVGLAALQIAQLAGTEIFATAGNDEKRALARRMGAAHVMDSRSLDFADEVMEITDGRGVDVVLNSLAGEAIPKSLSVLAPYGRFLEIGKRDIYQNSRLGLRPFSRNLSFFAIDLSQLLRDRPAFIEQTLGDLMRQFEARELAPLPNKVYPIAQAPDAFREMASGKHIGKIVFSFADTAMPVQPAPGAPVQFRPDATYLVTGGVRGFGLAIAEWMIEHGARNLALVGASGASAQAAQAQLASHAANGVKILAAAVDVSDEAAVAQFLSEISATLPPLRGVVHGAMKMDDGVLQQLTPARLWNVLGPKAGGAWNLHALTLGLQLDFFVLISSVSSLVGNPGQGNYAAANAFLDALAHHRHALGLPALAVNWGHLGEVGYAARHANVSEHLARYGVAPVALQEALSMLGRLLQSEVTEAAAMRIDWERWAEANPRVKKSPRYSRIISFESSGGRQEGGPGGVAAAILSASGAERLKLLETFIRETAARVLGTSASKLDPARPLSELGLDSLMGIELVNRIEEGLGRPFPTEKLMGGPSIVTLARILGESLPTPAAGSSEAVSGIGTQSPSIQAEPENPPAEETKKPGVLGRINRMVRGRK